MRVRTYGFVRCFTRPPDTSARNHRHEVDHVEAMSSPCWCSFESSVSRVAAAAPGPAAPGRSGHGLGRGHGRRLGRRHAASSRRGGTVTVAAGGATVTVSAGGVVSVSVGVVVVAARDRADLPCPPKNVVSRPPPDAELPATSSGTVMITAATRKPSSPVRIAGLQLRRRGTARAARGSRHAAATRSAAG